MSDQSDAGVEDTLFQELGDATSVLLLAPVDNEHEASACTALLTPTDPADENLILVTFIDSPDERLRELRRHDFGTAADTTLVAVGDVSRGVEPGGGLGDTQTDGDVRVRTVRNASDLPRLGITLSDLATDLDTGGRPTALCFHSVSALLQYADSQRVFRFLHTLRSRLRSSGVVSHYHLDPTAHDQQTLNTLRPLFDAVVEVTDDGYQVVQS